MRDLGQKDKGYPNWKEEKMVPAQQGCLQLVTCPTSPECTFLTEEAGKGENCHFFARMKRKQSMSGHNLVGSWVNLYFIPIIECIP